MPVISIEASKTLPKETKQELIKEVSESLAKSLNVPVQAIVVMIIENKGENIGVAGKPVSE